MASSSSFQNSKFVKCGPRIDSDDEEDHMKEIYMDFGDMSKTVKFLELPSLLPQTSSLNVSTNNRVNHTESEMLTPILEDETESDSSNSSVIDLDVEVY